MFLWTCFHRAKGFLEQGFPQPKAFIEGARKEGNSKRVQHQDFSGVHPSQYYYGPNALNYRVLIGYGLLALVWRQHDNTVRSEVHGVQQHASREQQEWRARGPTSPSQPHSRRAAKAMANAMLFPKGECIYIIYICTSPASIQSPVLPHPSPLLRIKLKCGLSVWTHLESE